MEVLIDMTMSEFEAEFKKKVCSEIALVSRGLDRYQVDTPFTFNDGDALKIMLKKNAEGKWVLSDEGHTYMHISYEDIDINAKTRAKVISEAKNIFGIKDMDGELVIEIPDQRYGDSLFSMIQGLIQIFDVIYLRRENVRTAFMEDFKNYIKETFSKVPIHFDYSPPKFDDEKLYPVDCLIETKTKPIMLFAISNDSQCRLATMSIMHYESLSMKFYPMAIIENLDDITTKDYARLANVSMKQFVSLDAAKERMIRSIEDVGLVLAES